jgi:hypothetical protein
MVYFNEEDLLVGQMIAHHGMMEIYAHLAASGILFVVSILSVVFLLITFQRTKTVWPGIIYGFFYTGLIGFGEFADHLFQDPFMSTSLHYLQLSAAPFAMAFYYLGIEEYYYRCSHPDEELHTISNEVAIGAFAGILTLVFIMGGLAGTPWDNRLEGPFLILIILPLLFLTGLFIKITRKLKKSMLAFYFPLMGITLSALIIIIWLGRVGDVNKNAALYIVSHSLQNVFHVATATVMILFVLAIREGLRENILHMCSVTEKSKLKKRKQKTRRRAFKDQ